MIRRQSGRCLAGVITTRSGCLCFPKPLFLLGLLGGGAVSGPSAQRAAAELTVGCCFGSRQGGRTLSPGPPQAKRGFPTQVSSGGGALVESLGLISWDFRITLSWSCGQNCTRDPVPVALPGEQSCLWPWRVGADLQTSSQTSL